MSKKIPVIEVFGPTIQGEGLMSGTVTHFLRTGGCPLKCSWCDSMYAVDPAEVKKNKTDMELHGMIGAVAELGYAPYITLTGGDPCMWDFERFTEVMNSQNIRVAVETQGTLFPGWLKNVDVITFSPKPPSSGNIVDVSRILEWITNNRPLIKGRICFKIVCFTLPDIEYAIEAWNLLTNSPVELFESFYFTAGTNLEANEEYQHLNYSTSRVMDVVESFGSLADYVLNMEKTGLVQLDHRAHVGCQQHVLLWPDKEKGV